MCDCSGFLIPPFVTQRWEMRLAVMRLTLESPTGLCVAQAVMRVM